MKFSWFLWPKVILNAAYYNAMYKSESSAVFLNQQLLHIASLMTAVCRVTGPIKYHHVGDTRALF